MSQPPPNPDALGTLSHYRLDSRLGSGGMGTVYRGVDRRTDVAVAVKVIHDHLQRDASFRERFRREAHVASLLTSPYAVRVLDFGTDQGHMFMVSEFVDGPRLTDRLHQGRLPLIEALTIASQVASALEEAHVRGVVHRDIKPDNILLTRAGEVKVADFGVSVLVYESGLTMPGLFVGTAAYAAPEQHAGQADTRTDIYALGVTLFQMVTGELPFNAPSPTGLMRLHQEAAVPVERLAGLPPSAVAIIRRCLAKNAQERYQRPAELVAALHTALHELGQTTSSRRGDLPPAAPISQTAAAAAAPVSTPPPAAPSSQPQLAPRPTSANRRPLLFVIFGLATAMVVCVTLGLVGYVVIEDQRQRGATATAVIAAAATADAQAAAATAAARTRDATATAVAQTQATAVALQATQVAATAQAATAAAQATQVAAQAAAQATQAASAQATQVAVAAQATQAAGQARAKPSPPPAPIKPGDVNALIPQLTADRAIFHHEAGELPQTQERVSLLAAKVNLLNVAVQANFITPDQSDWDYGIVFRETNTPRRHYRLIILSTGEWRLVLGEFGDQPKFTTVRSGRLSNLKTDAGDSNTLGIIATGDSAYVYVNAQQIATVTIGEHMVVGDVWIATGFFRENAVPGHSTQFNDFKVWALP